MLQNVRGYSLVEVMVVTAVGGLLMAAMMTMLGHQMESTNYAEDLMARIQLATSLTAVMSDLNGCQNTFAGEIMPAVGASKNIVIKDKSGAVVYNTTAVFERLQITSIQYTNVDIAPGDSSGRISLVVQLSRTRKGGGPPNLTLKNLEYRVFVNSATQQFQMCSTGLDQLLEEFSTGLVNIPANDFAEYTVITFSVNRLPKAAVLTSELIVGGIDIIWAEFRLYRNGTQIQYWTDGTSHSLGAAIQTTYTRKDPSITGGPTTYTLTFQRLANPSYGTGPVGINSARVLFDQR